MAILWRVFQHLLIWLAASVVIVVGATWGFAIGFTSHHLDRRVAAWAVATLASIFGGALVQRAPLAILALSVLGIMLAGVGVWLLAGGVHSAGIGYLVSGAVYTAALGPDSWRWMRQRR